MKSIWQLGVALFFLIISAWAEAKDKTEIVISSQRQSNGPAAFCTFNPNDKNAEVEGLNIDKLLPIASVSKVMTTYWAISRHPLNYRFITRFYVNELTTSIEIHIQGGFDPYFDGAYLVESLKGLKAHYNRAISKITYDENFKYTKNIASIHGASMHRFYPQAADVLEQLKGAKKYIVKTYPEMLSTEVEISYLPSNEFKSFAGQPTFLFPSLPMYKILKKMNNTSNNYIANAVFNSLGGPDEFRNFMSKSLGLNEKSLLFYNGAGTPYKENEDDAKSYNQATCRAIMQVLNASKVELARQERDLSQVMAVVGEDDATTDSYAAGNDQIDDRVIAKTGTIKPAIALAGQVLLDDEETYFAFVYYNKDGYNSSAARNGARAGIKSRLVELMKKHPSKKQYDYDVIEIESFDKFMKLYTEQDYLKITSKTQSSLN